jgi:transposase
LAVLLSPANDHDRRHAIAVVDAIPRLRRGRKKRPDQLLADRGYDAEHIRDSLNERGIEPRIVKKNPPGAGRSRDPQAAERWPIERTNAWFHNYRRINIRWERRPELYLAFLQLAQAMILTRLLDHAY